MEKFEFFDHTADAEFRAYGKTLEEAFSNAAFAMYSIITDDKIEPKITKSITVQGSDFEALLYNFLEEFLFLLDADFFLLSEIESIKINRINKEYMLSALIKGDNNTEKYTTDTHVKAVTYNEMIVKEEKGNCMVQVVLDL